MCLLKSDLRIIRLAPDVQERNYCVSGVVSVVLNVIRHRQNATEVNKVFISSLCTILGTKNVLRCAVLLYKSALINDMEMNS